MDRVQVDTGGAGRPQVLIETLSAADEVVTTSDVAEAAAVAVVVARLASSHVGSGNALA